MTIVVFFMIWAVGTLVTQSLGIGFAFAFLGTFVFRQNARISRLELRLKYAPPNLQQRSDTQGSSPSDARDAAKPQADVGAGSNQTIPWRESVHNDAPSHSPSTVETIGKPTPRPVPAISEPAAAPGASIQQILERLLGPDVASFIVRGNPIARVGVVILLFGVVFLLKFAAEEGVLPIELRLLGSAIGACVLMGIGWKKRQSRPQIALTLQGAAAGIFYITVFIAFKLYQLLPGALAFSLLVMVTVLVASLAVMQNAKALAVLAMIGGFLAPALTSEGGGNHVILFSYLTLLNIAIFGICFFKAWRAVNVTGFYFTFALASMWGATSYRPEHFASTQPFLIFFVVLYSAINVLFSLRSSAAKPGAVDTLMTFGTPFFGLLLQYGLVADMRYGMALSAAGFGAFFVALARYTFDKDRIKLKFLSESYFAVGLAFLSLAVPFAFSERLTAAIWALEAVALLWSGVRQKHLLTRVGGHILLALSAVSFLFDLSYRATDFAFFNPFFLGITLLSASFLFAGALLTRASPKSLSSGESQLACAYLMIALAWWFCGGLVEIERHLAGWTSSLSQAIPALHFRRGPLGLVSYSLFLSLSVLGVWTIARRWSLVWLSPLRFGLLPAHYFILLSLLGQTEVSGAYLLIHPFVSFGFLAWPIVFAVHYHILRREELADGAKIQTSQHALALWVLAALVSWQGYWVVATLVQGPNLAGEGWRFAALSAVPAILLLLVSRWAVAATHWPFKRAQAVYLKASWVIAAWVLVWPLFLNLSSSGDPAPLPYIPLINPLDLAQFVTVIALLTWWRRATRAQVTLPITNNAASGALCAALFVWSTALLFRSVHFYLGVPWKLSDLFDSNIIQSALSIYWSVLALVLMLLAHSKSWRVVWKFGALLIGVVVVKLLLIDMSNQGTIARIAAFMGVGILMLTIGYFAPIPPGDPSEGDNNSPIDDETRK